MTNFEKYKDAILFIANGGEKPALAKGGLAECIKTDCEECKFCVIDGSCTANLIKWLYEEYKEPAPTLTPKEKFICDIIRRGYITRDTDNKLSIHFETPGLMENGSWTSINGTYRIIDGEFFPFIKGGGCMRIEDLLKLEVCDD